MLTMLLVYLFVGLFVSFLCSMLEAVFLSVPRSHVAVMVERGSLAGPLLERMKTDVDRPLAAILTLNTFAHTIGAAGVGGEAARIWGEAWVGLVGFIVTILILVFSEIIPKTLGAVHAKSLAAPATLVIRFLIVTLWPFVVACDQLSKLLTRSARPVSFTRDELRSVARIAHHEGSIDQDESAVIQGLMGLEQRQVEQIMTPRTVVVTFAAGTTIDEALAAGLPGFARVPVVTGALETATGYVHRHDILQAIADGRLDTDVNSLTRPIASVPETANLRALMRAFTGSRSHILLVVDEHGAGVGVVTLEDLVEAILGVEIVDETDAVADMQQLARALRAGGVQS